MGQTADWANSGLTLTPGTGVAVSLQGPAVASTVSLSVSRNPVPEGEWFDVTACLKFGNVREVPTGTMRIPVVLSHGTSENGDWGKSLSGRSDGSMPIRTRYAIAISGTHQNSCGVISIPTHEDSDEDNETFTVALGGNLPSSVIAGATTSVAVTITESEAARADGDRVQYTPDDAPGQVTQQGQVSLSVSRNPVAEGSWVSVTACLKHGDGSRAVPTGTVRIPVVLRHGTSENGDWGSSLSGHTDGSQPIRTGYAIAISGSHQSSCGLVNIPTHQDSDADDETFTVAMGSSLPPALTAGTPSSVTVTITDDDEAPQGLEATAGDIGAIRQPERAQSPDQSSPPQQSPHASLIGQIQGWRNDPQWVSYKSHTDRWDRVLLAFGESVSDSSLTPMTAAEEQTYADTAWGGRWVPVAAALSELEANPQQSDIFAPIDQTDLPDRNAEPLPQAEAPEERPAADDPSPAVQEGTDGPDMLFGGEVDDEIHGQGGHDLLYGEGGQDVLYGGSGADIMYGGAGDDELHGDADSDLLNGGAGDDDLSGGSGADQFVFLPGDTGDKIIVDFDRDSRDLIVLRGGSWPSVSDILASEVAEPGGYFVYTLASGLTVETDVQLEEEDFGN